MKRLLLLLCLSLSAPVRADQVPPDLYQEALQSISEGRNRDAYETLKRLIDKEPTHAGAWLEVALIQCSLGKAEEAERLFKEIETRFHPPAAILELINRTRRDGCAQWNRHRQLSVTAARGYDRNVNQGASDPSLDVVDGTITLSPDFLPRADHYSLLGVDYLQDISGNGSTGFGQFQLRKNDNWHQYDSGSAYLGIETPWRLGDWTLRQTAMLGLVSLGGKLYQRQGQLQLRLGPPLPLPGSFQPQVLVGVSHVNYLSLSHFDTSTGELRATLNYNGNSRHLAVGFGLLDDRADALRPGGDRHGQQASLNLRQGLTGGAWLDLGYTRQTWHSERAYAPGLITATRAQRTHALRAALVYPLSPNQNLQVEARRLINQENISIFQYSNRVLQVSWQWQR